MSNTATQFTDKVVEEYLKDPYHCPHCGDENEDATIRWGELDLDWGTTDPPPVVRTSFCNKCGQSWEEIYPLTWVKSISQQREKDMNDTVTQFDDKTAREYMEDPYHCPHCGNDICVLAQGTTQQQDGSLVRTLLCSRCGQSWDETYTLTGVGPTPPDSYRPIPEEATLPGIVEDKDSARQVTYGTWIETSEELPEYGEFVLFCEDTVLRTVHLGWLESEEDIADSEDLWYKDGSGEWFTRPSVFAFLRFPPSLDHN